MRRVWDLLHCDDGIAPGANSSEVGTVRESLGLHWSGGGRRVQWSPLRAPGLRRGVRMVVEAYAMVNAGEPEARDDGWVARMRARRRSAVLRVGKRLRKRLSKYLSGQSRVGDPIIFDKALFPWTRTLETHWRTIRGELDRLLEYRRLLPTFQEISLDNARIATGDRWKTFILYGFGDRSDRNCALCPETTRLLETIPGLKTAWFSILSPRYHVPRHKGVTKGLLRCHLGLVVPDEAEKCRMKVGAETFHWEEGQCVVFDDLRRHEVWNDTDQERVVLLIDFERPMHLPGRLVSRAFLAALRRTAYFRDARRNQAAWEQRFHGEVEALRASAEAE